MKKKIFYTVLSFFLALVSVDVVAQLHPIPTPRLAPPLPNNLYIEKYIATHPSLPVKTEKVGTSELFDFYRLPLDNMICAMPTKKIKGHIKVYDPTMLKEYVAVDIPNAAWRGEFVK